MSSIYTHTYICIYIYIYSIQRFTRCSSHAASCGVCHLLGALGPGHGSRGKHYKPITVTCYYYYKPIIVVTLNYYNYE